MYKGFQKDIERMNEMFDLPVNQSIELDRDLHDKVVKFHKTLSDEVNELLDLRDILDDPSFKDGMPHYVDPNIDHYVALADLLGDVIVYCASEAVKHGIYLPDVIKAIMDSQLSKLGPDGEVIKDANGKFLKGENYQPPEPTIKKLLQYRNRMVAMSLHPPYIIPESLKDDEL